MQTLIAIDPGLYTSGVALFEDGLLKLAVNATQPKTSSKLPIARRIFRMVSSINSMASYNRHDVMVVEWQQIYQRGSGRSKANPNSILLLTGLAGALSYHATRSNPAATVLTPTPAEWKRQVPKRVITARVNERLSDDERSNIVNPTHDTWEAVGLGLWALDRWPV